MTNERVSAEQSNLQPEAPNQAEAGILGVLMWLPAFAGPRLARVDVEFRDPRHRIILEGIRALHGGGKTAELVSVVTWLGDKNHLEVAGGREYVAHLVDVGCYNGAH